MALNRRDWTFLIIAVVVVGTLVVLSMLGKPAPPISAIPQHAGLAREAPRADCMACHDPKRDDATAPINASHPSKWRDEKVSCTLCHKIAAGQTATASSLRSEETRPQ